MKLKNTERYYLPGTKGQYIHLATVTHNTREFMCFADRVTNKIYIEETTFGNLMYIQDDQLARGLYEFLLVHNILDMSKPLIVDKPEGQ